MSFYTLGSQLRFIGRLIQLRNGGPLVCLTDEVKLIRELGYNHDCIGNIMVAMSKYYLLMVSFGDLKVYF
jgi:hypothetical protein